MPVLNEEARIQSQLDALLRLDGVDEVVVVDGGSVDRTRALVEVDAKCRLVTGPRGRALQMNTGAAVATGNILLFLHADVRLPEDAARWVRDTLDDPGVVAGAFRTRTVADGRRTWVAGWLGLADLRSRYTRLPYGDQALFLRRETFTRVGGFPAQPLFEDLEISRRLRRLGRVRTVKTTVGVSGRRFMARPWHHAFIMNVLPPLYRLGVPPATLARSYRDVR
jgi:rSAM/selenodomain-associated transferase 2